MRIILLLIICEAFIPAFSQQNRRARLGVAGMTHGHVNWILDQIEGPNYEVVGIAEENDTLAERLFSRYRIPERLRYYELSEMIRQTSPDGILAFNSIYEHLEVVEVCAPRNVHVMVEKPLAVNLEHAAKMAALAGEHNILLLTNYETTWYGTTARLMDEVIKKESIGEIRKVIVRDGHQGPKEIGVNHEFLVWLTDPVLNGGGALIDFGCYGANLITALMNNQKPLSVTAVTRQIKPGLYPDVEDEAIIILSYPKCQGIIQASWNWPMNRKDMDIYGTKGAIYQYDGEDMAIYLDHKTENIKSADPEFPHQGPFTYFSAAIHGEQTILPTDLSSLENNLIVVEILDAARRSATGGKKIDLGQK
jgi:predicted dehydrogenase